MQQNKKFYENLPRLKQQTNIKFLRLILTSVNININKSYYIFTTYEIFIFELISIIKQN